MTNIVEYSVEGKVALITLNRPEARNAVNGDVASGLEAAIDKLEADDNVWIAILQANTQGQQRPVFCAGADLKAINSGQAAALNTPRGGFGGFVYRERKKPVIAAVDGLAVGSPAVIKEGRARTEDISMGVDVYVKKGKFFAANLRKIRD